jgi:hypothetical protein
MFRCFLSELSGEQTSRPVQRNCRLNFGQCGVVEQLAEKVRTEQESNTSGAKARHMVKPFTAD